MDEWINGLLNKLIDWLIHSLGKDFSACAFDSRIRQRLSICLSSALRSPMVLPALVFACLDLPSLIKKAVIWFVRQATSNSNAAVYSLRPPSLTPMMKSLLIFYTYSTVHTVCTYSMYRLVKIYFIINMTIIHHHDHDHHRHHPALYPDPDFGSSRFACSVLYSTVRNL